MPATFEPPQSDKSQYGPAKTGTANPSRPDSKGEGVVVSPSGDFEAYQSAVPVGPELTQCIEDLSRANERLRQNQERLMARASALEKEVSKHTAQRSGRKTTEPKGIYRALAEDLIPPVWRMKTLSRMLLGEDRTLLTENGKDYAEEMAGAVLQLERLVHDLLKFGRLDYEDLVLEPVSVEIAVCRVIGELVESISNSGGDVHTVGVLPEVQANEALLRQVLYHVLDNALKFVAPGVVPCICIRAETKGDNIRIIIEDNGIGVAPEHHERIFDLFERVQETYPGTGLGLALVRKIVEQMNGRAGIESQTGKGSCLWIELPQPA